MIKKMMFNLMQIRLPQILLVTLSFAITACGDNETNSEMLRPLIEAKGITGDPTTGRTLPDISSNVAQLGKKLFFTKGLGGDSDAACVTCHHPTLGGGDNLSLSIGVGAENPELLGEGRVHNALADHHDGGPTVPRNAPTTFNMALWDQALFHDGRVESLGKTPGVNGDDGMGIRTPDSAFNTADTTAGVNLTTAQARFPVTSPEEMRGFVLEAGNSNANVRTALEAKIAGFGGWDAEFTTAFGNATITYDRIATALAEYERSQIFINTPWKAYVDGNETAISEPAKRGAILFFNDISKGGANCASCHSGDFYTDEKYYVLATPQIGRGKGNNNGTLTNDDFGRFRESAVASDKYAFRTPTLLNVEVTGPWGHAGAYTSLEAVTRHMLNPSQAIANYDVSQLDSNIQSDDMATNTQFALDQLTTNRAANVTNVHRSVTFSENNVTDLVEFMKSLTDPCVKDRACLSPWIPDGTDTNPDALRLVAEDRNGSPL